METLPLLPMPADWEPTRATLHAYAKAVGTIPRAHATPHDKWWHISLKVHPDGLVTDTMALPDGGSFIVRMDLRSHEVVVATSHGDARALSMSGGLTGRALGEQLIAIVSELGLNAEYATEKVADDDDRAYEPHAAEQFFAALFNIHRNFEVHKASLAGEVGPIQLWPHGFDLAFEWFGTRTDVYEENGESVEAPAQLNLGFYPAGSAYFYSNPWPFEASLTSLDLPAPSRWHTEGWEGSILYYDELLAEDDPAAMLLEYSRAVFDVAAPTLLAE